MERQAISSTTVKVLLDYLCPLSGPLPPHLISAPLKQRHHFLGLSTENAEEYLAWPSEHRSHAVQLLQSEPIQSHDQSFTVHYTVDSDDFVAHVRITSDLRLLFLWNFDEGWQYHDIQLMPFPSNSYSSFDTALVALSPDDFLQEPTYSIAVDSIGQDEDAYWASYSNDDKANNHLSNSAKLDDPSSEDAYWAQYSKVQGSGDSTVPSPRPQKKNLDPESSLPERIIVPSDDFQAHHPEPYNPFQPPSPDALARRLAALSASTSGAASPSLIDDAPTTDSETHTPQLPEVVPAEPSISPSQQAAANEFVVVDVPPPIVAEDATQDILKDNIQSIYRLWMLHNHGRSPEDHKSLFISTVRQALEQL